MCKIDFKNGTAFFGGLKRAAKNANANGGRVLRRFFPAASGRVAPLCRYTMGRCGEKVYLLWRHVRHLCSSHHWARSMAKLRNGQ